MECANRDSLKIVVTGLYDDLLLWNVSCNKKNMFLIFKTIFSHTSFFMYLTRQMKFKKSSHFKDVLQETVKLINLQKVFGHYFIDFYNLTRSSS